MVRWLLSCTCAGCFVEPPVGSVCPIGSPGCDCDDGACVAGSECVASIEKCVPEDCTPGTHTCTCAADGSCEGALLCREGVCIEESMIPETGEPASTADASAGTVETFPTGEASAATEVTSSDPATTAPTSETGPGSTSTDGTTALDETGSTSTGTVTPTCLECVLDTWDSMSCVDERLACEPDPSCAGNAECVMTVAEKPVAPTTTIRGTSMSTAR